MIIFFGKPFANIAPTCVVTNPVNNQFLTAGLTFTLKATATDSDGTIKKVEFYRDNVIFKTQTTKAPYYAQVINIQEGVYTFKARATDNLNSVKTSTAITVFVFRDYQKSLDSLKFINASLQNIIFLQARNDSIIIDLLQKQISDLQNTVVANDSLKNLFTTVMSIKDSLTQLRKEYDVPYTFAYHYPLRATYDSIRKVLDIKYLP